MNDELDTVMRLLQSERRRIVLEHLAERQDTRDTTEVTVRADDLSRHVAAIETGVDSNTVSHTDHRSVNVELLHSHLPVLDDHGILTFDTTTRTVTTTTRTRHLAHVLRALVETVEESDLELTRSPESNN